MLEEGKSNAREQGNTREKLWLSSAQISALKLIGY